MYFGQTRPMEVYNRQIKYLDYMENGIRMKGAGFIKLERQDNLCSINLQISGLYRKDRFSRPFLMLCNGEERELCRLQFADGGIKLHLDRLDCGNLDGRGLRYEQLMGFRIPISEGKEIISRLEEPIIWAPEPEKGESITPKTVPDETGEETKEKIMEIITEEMKTEITEEIKEETEISASIKDDKWEQLWSVYPHKCPFSDDREYLAVGPGDFVVLSEKNYRLVNNSFLLHGYYNHHHLILTRIRERNRMCYYIGVPGNFYEREKRTAIMFGFKSFECAVEPAQDGDFGYYMIPVEL